MMRKVLRWIAVVIATALIPAAPCAAEGQMTGQAAVQQFAGAKFVGKSSSGKTEVTLMLERGDVRGDGSVTFGGRIDSVAVQPGGHTEAYSFEKAVFDPKTNLLVVPTSKGTARLSWNGQAFSGDIKFLFVTISTVTLQKQ